MALSNAERQAALKARREQAERLLVEQNTALQAENLALKTEVETLKNRIHKMELAALRLQLKAQTPPKKPVASAAAKGPPASKSQDKPKSRNTKS